MREFSIVIISTVFELTRALLSSCNPLSCLISANALFKVDHGQTVCSKFKKVQECVNVCSPLFSENTQDLKDGLQRMSDKICKDEKTMRLDELLHKKCIEHKKFQMLTCIYEAWNLVSEEENVKKKNLFYCRKIIEVEKCPNDVYMCKDETASYIEYLTARFFAPLQEEFCFGYSLADIWALDVQHIPNIDDYKTISKCLDINFKQFMSCIPEKWIDNFSYNEYHHDELCTAVDTFLDCVNVIVDKKCGENISNAFLPISRKVHQGFQSQCMKHALEVSSTTENVASRQVLTPHTPEKLELAKELEGDNVNASNYEDDSDLRRGYIIVHFSSLEYGGSGHNKGISVILMSVILLLISAMNVL